MGKGKEIVPSPVPAENRKETVRTITITFRYNRSFDLHIGKKITIFGPRESKPIPVRWLKHRDFLQQKSKFIVKGV
jgi:hypothetical protein